MRAHRTIKALHGCFFIELFSGSGRLSAALRKSGISTKEFDLLHGPSGDILKIEVLHHLRKLILDPKCLGI